MGFVDRVFRISLIVRHGNIYHDYFRRALRAGTSTRIRADPPRACSVARPAILVCPIITRIAQVSNMLSVIVSFPLLYKLYLYITASLPRQLDIFRLQLDAYRVPAMFGRDHANRERASEGVKDGAGYRVSGRAGTGGAPTG